MADRDASRCEDPRLLLEHAPALTRRLYGRRTDGRSTADTATAPTGVALQVLVVIDDAPELNFAQIAERLALDESSVRHAVRSLIDGGLLESTPDPRDARRRVRAVTASGRRRAAALVAEARRLLAEHHKPQG